MDMPQEPTLPSPETSSEHPSPELEREITFRVNESEFQEVMDAMALTEETHPGRFIWLSVKAHIDQIHASYAGIAFTTRCTLTFKTNEYATDYLHQAFTLGFNKRKEARAKSARPVLKAIEGRISKP